MNEDPTTPMEALRCLRAQLDGKSGGCRNARDWEDWQRLLALISAGSGISEEFVELTQWLDVFFSRKKWRKYEGGLPQIKVWITGGLRAVEGEIASRCREPRAVPFQAGRETSPLAAVGCVPIFTAPPMNENTDARLLRLHSADNVLTVISTLEAGESIRVDGATVAVAVRVLIGHKVAARDIGAGERIVKYGAPIGSATRAISAGEHVHTHNVQSDYIPTFARGEGAHYEHAQP